MAVDKYRPLLSERDISIVIAGLDKLEASPAKEAVRKKFALLQWKITAKAIVPAASVDVEAGKSSLELAMGISTEEQWEAEVKLAKMLGETPPSKEEFMTAALAKQEI